MISLRHGQSNLEVIEGPNRSEPDDGPSTIPLRHQRTAVPSRQATEDDARMSGILRKTTDVYDVASREVW
jgi:hypothetical protein